MASLGTIKVTFEDLIPSIPETPTKTIKDRRHVPSGGDGLLDAIDKTIAMRDVQAGQLGNALGNLRDAYNIYVTHRDEVLRLEGVAARQVEAYHVLSGANGATRTPMEPGSGTRAPYDGTDPTGGHLGDLEPQDDTMATLCTFNHHQPGCPHQPNQDDGGVPFWPTLGDDPDKPNDNA